MFAKHYFAASQLSHFEQKTILLSQSQEVIYSLDGSLETSILIQDGHISQVFIIFMFISNKKAGKD